MRKVILEGDERTVERIINENRVRVGRGLVKFSPAEDAATDEKAEEPEGDSKEVPAEEPKGEPAIVDDKKPKTKK